MAQEVIATADIDTSYSLLRWGYNPLSGDSVFYETLTTVYEDGRTNSTEEIVGDTTTAINFFATRATESAKRFAIATNEVWKKPQVIAFILQANSVLTTMFDTSIIQISVDLYGPAVDSTTWDVISTQGNFTGTMTIAPSGNNLRMTIGATNYTLLPVGDSWIRFQNFPAGSFTDLHRVNRGGSGLEFRNLEETIILKK